MYDKHVFIPTILGYDYKYSFNSNNSIAPNEIVRTIYRSLSTASNNSFKTFYPDLDKFLRNNLYSQNVYINDPVMSLYYQFISQMYDWMGQGTYYGDIFDNNTKTTSELSNIKKASNQYKLMAYLNIWQQLVVMWTGDARGSLAGQYDIVSSMLLPVNNYLEAKVNDIEYKVNNNAIKTNYFLISDFNKQVTLTNTTGMYICYLLVTAGLAAIKLWWITKKDFV